MAQIKMTKLNALEMVTNLPSNILDELALGSEFSGSELADKLFAMLETERKSAEKRAATSATKTVSDDARNLYNVMVESGINVADNAWVIDTMDTVKTVQKANAMFRNLAQHGYAVKSHSVEDGHVQYTLTDKVMPPKEEN